MFAFVRDGVDAPFVHAGRPLLAASIDGVRLGGHLRHRSFLAEAARPGTTYRELFVRNLRPGVTVVDGGAHVGLYTVLASRGVGAGRVLAFEPDPYNFAALAANVRRLGRGNVALHRKALGDACGVAEFHLSRATIGSSLVRRGDAAQVARVEVTTIDDELRDENPPALLVKLNVESAEPLVLDGMRETLDRIADVTMFVEIDPAGLRNAGFEPAELVARLESLGFRVSSIHLPDQSLRPVDPGRKGHVYCER